MATSVSIYPTDIIESILAEFEKDHFPTDREFFHAYIYECKAKHSELLKRFIFDEIGGHPHSKTVEDALTNLETASLLGQKNPDFTIYEIKPELKKHYEEYIKEEFSTTEKQQIKEIADGLFKKIEEWEKNK